MGGMNIWFSVAGCRRGRDMSGDASLPDSDNCLFLFLSNTQPPIGVYKVQRNMVWFRGRLPLAVLESSPHIFGARLGFNMLYNLVDIICIVTFFSMFV